MTLLRSAAWRSDGAPVHWLHSADRAWPETNCYLDLWIELLHALGRDPLPILGVAAALDWEADHFTFLKPSAAAIFKTTGVTLHEMALWDMTETHLEAQLALGAVPLLEVDAFYLPDTRSNAYRQVHTKTTIGITALDPGRAWLSYIHNAGHFSLNEEDYRNIIGAKSSDIALFPYAELARVAADPPELTVTRDFARRTIGELARTRSPGNPVLRFAAALPHLLVRVGQDPALINALCFNTTRQFGGAFDLFADHLEMLGENGTDARWLATNAKTLQFQIARGARRGRTDPTVERTLDGMSVVWERCMTTIGAISAAAAGVNAGWAMRAATG